MKRLCLLLGVVTALLYSDTTGKLDYPPAPVSAQVDDYHGVKIADPHRTLENADSPATQKWIEEENKLTFSYLAKLPGREEIKQRLTSLWNYEKFGGFFEMAGRYFYQHNSGLQNQSVVYVLDALTATPRVLLDPNTYRADGTAALSGHAVSWDGKLYAYSVAQAGSDWSDWHVRDVATGKDLPDSIQWTKNSSPAWTIDNKGFYYERFPEPPPGKLLTAVTANQKVYYHKLGDPQSSDKEIFSLPEHPAWLFGCQTSQDGRYLLIHVFPEDAGKNLVYYLDLQTAEAKVIALIPDVKFLYDFIETDGSRFFFRTTDGASRGRVVAIDVQQPRRENWKEIVAESPETLDSVRMASGKLMLAYMKDAHSIARLVTVEGKPAEEVKLPELGTVSWSHGVKSDRELLYSFTSYLAPQTIYRLDLTSGNSTVLREPKISFDSAAYETKLVFYPSKDGTKIPLYLSYRKGLKLDGRNPTLLYGYGGFDIAITPTFNVPFAQWMQMGGVVAVANLRGGSEYGEEWHLAGTKSHKQNVFDDFIAAAEWLISNQYTSTPKLAIFGGSNGGLLVGAVLNQRPDLFGAAMPAVGVMDMLRFDRFGYGETWTGDYGSPQNPEEFPAIRAYSPLHNIRKGVQYPPTLITTSDHDDRVMPGHSLKYAATLQEAQEGPAPILIRVETRAGHGAGKPTSKQIDEWADRFVFLESALGVKM